MITVKSIYNEFAKACYRKKDFHGAIRFVRQHLELYPQDAEAHLNYGKVLTNTEQFALAEEALLTAYAMSDHRPDYLLDLQVLYHLTGRENEYQVVVAKLKEEIPGHPAVTFNCAVDKIKMGDTYGGFADLEAGRMLGVYGRLHELSHRLERLEDIEGKRIALIGEGGIGDEIINARYAPLIQKHGGTPMIQCRKELVPIFSHLADKCSEQVTDYDYYMPGMAATAFFKVIQAEQYLFAKPEYVDKHRLQDDGKKKIGICWHGNSQYEWEQGRAVPKELLTGLADGSVAIHSLQKDDTDLDLSTWDDTLGAMANLDMVVTSCTSVAHAAGALGKRTLVLAPFAPYYLWLTKEKWYPDVTVFQKRKHGHDADKINQWIHEG